MDKLWVDKHRPKVLESLDFHQDLSTRLKKLSEIADFPHLLFYGPSGVGKKTRVMSFLNEVYGSGVYKLKSELREFKVNPSSSSTVECNIVASNYHLDMTPADAEFHDKVIVQTLIKEIASTAQLDQKSQRTFKIIVINETDKLSREAQAALRRTMEKYIAKCRLILICENASKVILPIKSRCLMIRVGAPSEKDIGLVLDKVAKKEGINIRKETMESIIRESERNLRRAIILLQTWKMQKGGGGEGEPLHVAEWRLAIRDIAKDVMKEQTAKKLREIREKVYDLLINCIPGEYIIKYVVEELSIYADDRLKLQLLYWAAYHEVRMQMGNKPIFHIEAFLARIMNIFKKSVESFS